MCHRRFWFLALLSLLSGSRSPLPGLELRPAASGPTDLAVSGLLTGLAPGEKRFVRWTDLAALPTTKLRLEGEFLPGPQEVTVVFLADLWRALPVAPGADLLLATCTDGYASVYSATFMRDCRPFLVLAINGLDPGHWPPPGLTFNPGPYAISISPTVTPAVSGLLDPGHKKPWGVTALQVARQADAFGELWRGARATLSPRAATGREIWINSCASCHRGPADTFGGTKSDRPFALLAGLAAQNPTYFRSYVRNPQAFSPAAKMEGHPHYTDEHLTALIAFLTAEPAASQP